MEWTRAKDWLIGAAGMLLILAVVVVILWGMMTNPAGEDEAGTAPSPSSSSSDAGATPDAKPPTDLDEDEVWLGDLTLDAGTVVTAGSTLRDVRAVGQDVVTGPAGLIAGQLAVDATVPFDAVAAELGDGTVVRPADGGQAMVVRTVEAFGRELRVVATGTVDVERGSLVLEPSSIDIGGPDFLSNALAAVVRTFVTIDHDIEGLPEGLVLQDVAVQDDGFRANLEGEDVKLGP